MARISLKMNVIVRKDKTKIDLASYHHASLFSPVYSILEYPINNNHLTSWPGLTRDLIVKKNHRSSLRQKAISIKKDKTFNQQKMQIRTKIRLKR